MSGSEAFVLLLGYYGPERSSAVTDWLVRGTLIRPMDCIMTYGEM